MPNVAVTITNDTTNVVSQAISSSVGTFTVVGLKPGPYTVAAEATGFKRSVQSGVTVEVATTSNVVLQMVPGATDATVSVTAAAISLNTTSPSQGTTLEPELVKTAPIEIKRMAAFFAEGPTRLRPHYKNHKCVALARRQLDCGAIGITCATLGEAEALVQGGIQGILLANELAGAVKIERFAQLSRETDLIVAVDNERTIAALASNFPVEMCEESEVSELSLLLH